MPKLRVYPYKQGSASAKKFAETIDGKVLKHVGSKFRPRAGDVVVNWGAARVPDFAPATTLNPDVTVAGCKLASFRALAEGAVRVPTFWDSRAALDAALAAGDAKFPIVCRTKLRGHSGDGIVIANNADELVAAPLYTQYVKKKDEYRVHVFGDKAIFVQRKARKLDEENPNWQIRNLAGGFVFAEVLRREGDEEQAFDAPRDVQAQALAAIAALGLDFGGVDVMWNDKEKQAYVLEVNTACGLEDRTADRYAGALRDLVADI